MKNHWLFGGGYFEIGRIRGARVRLHWSLPIAAFVWSGLRVDLVGWVGFVVLVLVHELGHAAMVWRIGDRVTGIQLHAFGGSCSWAGDPTQAERALVAWGGVLAQGVVWLIASLFFWVFEPKGALLQQIAYLLTTENLELALFNLIPIPPLDGYEAWKLLPTLWRSRSELSDYLRERDARARQKNRDNEAAKRWEKKRRATDETVDEILRDHDKEGEAPPVPSEVQRVLDEILKNAKKPPSGE